MNKGLQESNTTSKKSRVHDGDEAVDATASKKQKLEVGPANTNTNNLLLGFMQEKDEGPKSIFNAFLEYDVLTLASVAKGSKGMNFNYINTLKQNQQRAFATLKEGFGTELTKTLKSESFECFYPNIRIGVDDTKAIAEIVKATKSLKRFEIGNASFEHDRPIFNSEEDIIKIVKALKQNSSITHFGIHSKTFGSESIKELADVLKVNKLLKCVSFEENDNMTVEGFFDPLKEAMQETETLTEFEFCNIYSPKMVNSIGQLLNWSTSVTSVLINCETSFSFPINAIADAIIEKRNLEELYLYSCKLDNGMATELAALLPKMPSLTKLNISNNNIRNAGLAALAAVLPNSSLTTLNISNNKIGYEGVPALAAALPESSLKELDLSDNDLYHNHNRDLKKGDMDDNMSIMVGNLEKKLIQQGCLLKKLSLNRCNIGRSEANDMRNFFARNLPHIKLNAEDNSIINHIYI